MTIEQISDFSKKYFHTGKDELKNTAIVCLVSLVIILSFKNRCYVLNEPIRSKSGKAIYSQEVVEPLSISNKIDWFLASLGAFSTILLAIFGFSAFKSLTQQKEIEDTLSKMKSIRKEAETDAQEIKTYKSSIEEDKVQ